MEAGVAAEMKRTAPGLVQSAMVSVAHSIERDLGVIDYLIKYLNYSCNLTKL